MVFESETLYLYIKYQLCDAKLHQPLVAKHLALDWLKLNCVPCLMFFAIFLCRLEQYLIKHLLVHKYVWCDSVYLECLLNASCVVFVKFMHLHCCISFRYARWTTRGHEAHDGGIEPQDGEWLMHPEDGRTVWSACLDWR